MKEKRKQTAMVEKIEKTAICEYSTQLSRVREHQQQDTCCHSPGFTPRLQHCETQRPISALINTNIHESTSVN
jgi:hypothetical protein